MKRTSYKATGIAAKGGKVSVHYQLNQAPSHSKGACTTCNGTTDVAIVNINITKVTSESGAELSLKNHAAKAAGGKVLGTLKNGKRICGKCVATMLLNAATPDKSGQVFAS